MDMDELLERVLALPEPWKITGAELDEATKTVNVLVTYTEPTGPCPECGMSCKRHDSVERKWRHLDLCNHQTWIVCKIPRVRCGEHKVRTLQVPWADGWTRFTAQFECVVIDWLKEASMTAVARNLGLSWDQVNGVQERAVSRGLALREEISATRIGVDETSFQKRHEYVTIVTKLYGSCVLYVSDGRGRESLDGFFGGLTEAQLMGIEVVAMDMHKPYIYSAASFVPDILNRLCFDRFHVAQMFSKAVDQQRRSETKRLMKEGDDSLKGTRYLWLRQMAGLPKKLRTQLAVLLETATSVGDVWAIKEAASKLWHYKSKTWAQKAWVALCKAARQLEIPALDKVIDTILLHLFGIVNAITLKASNAASESINSRVQALKKRANGYRSRQRFREAIMFHLGGLDLYPRTTAAQAP